MLLRLKGKGGITNILLTEFCYVEFPILSAYNFEYKKETVIVIMFK